MEKIKELRKRAEIRRWCREHPDIEWYNDRTGCGRPCVGMGLLVCLVLAVLLFVGCRTVKYVPVETVRIDTTYITQHHRDSVYVHDSTYFAVKGDTVVMEKWHTQVKWKERYDTVYVSKIDSVPVPIGVVKEVPVEKPLTWWQQTRLHIANIMLLLGLVAIGLWLLKKYVL